MSWPASPPRGGEALWLQKLHRLGLLNDSFRPDAEMVILRTYLRHRAELIQDRARHILHRQKALQQMNLQLHPGWSDITGVTGMQLLRAIVAGERDPKVLAGFRQPGCKADEATIVKALTGSWREAHLFVLKQSLDLFDFFSVQISACDTEIERQVSAIKPPCPRSSQAAKPSTNRPKVRVKTCFASSG